MVSTTQVLKQFTNSSPKYVFFSGGKDSLATLLLAYEYWGRSNFEVIYTEIPGNTHKLNVSYVYQVCKELNVKLHHMKNLYYGDFFTCMKKWGLPWVSTKWCYSVFKVVMWRTLPEGVMAIGVKKKDSLYRKVSYKNEIMKLWWCRKNIGIFPILDWSDEQILDLINTYGFKLCPCYEKYLDSGNCMYCSFKNKAKIARVMLDEEWRNKIIDGLSAIRTKGKKGVKYIVERWLKAGELNSCG